MALARNGVLALGAVAYVIVVAGIVLQRLPVDSLVANPPVLGIGLATGVFVVYSLVVGWLFEQAG